MRALVLMLAWLPGLAWAAPLYSVAWETGQRGTFKEESCETKGAADEPAPAESATFDFCACEADIVYPQMQGLTSMAAQEAINKDLQAMVRDRGCGTDVAYKSEEGKSGSIHRSYFDVKLAVPTLVSFLVWNDDYGAGAAHNNWTVQGATYDLATGRKLLPRDLVDEAALPALNRRIRDELAKGDFGEKNLQQLQERSSDFLLAGECAGCAYVLTREGMEIVFQLYEVASFAHGNPKVVIGWPELKESIRNQLVTS